MYKRGCWQILFILAFTFSLNSVIAATQNVQVSTLSNPIPVVTSKNRILVYELHFVNTQDTTIRINRIEVRSEKHRQLASYAGTKLIQNSLTYQGDKQINKNIIELEKNMGSFVYIWIALDKNEPIPHILFNKIWTSSLQNERFVKAASFSYQIDVSKDKPLVIAPPLKGYNWIAVAAPSNHSYHRRTTLPIEGRFYLAQRYAVDWEQMCDNGHTVQNNVQVNQNWHAYGNTVFAVSDGIVAEVHDHVTQENVPPNLPPVSPNLEDIPGNYIMLNIKQNAKDYYVLYAHLQPGSIKVKKGQRVTQGQELALLGNTGNSSAPHLHFQVSDANHPLKSEGLPFVFDAATIQGKARILDDQYGVWQPLHSHLKKYFSRIIPVDGQVFYFSDEKKFYCRS